MVGAAFDLPALVAWLAKEIDVERLYLQAPLRRELKPAYGKPDWANTIAASWEMFGVVRSF